MKKILYSIFIALIFTICIVAKPTTVKAQTYMGGCTSIGQCINNRQCVQDGNGIVYPNGTACGSAQLGKVQPPDAIRKFGLLTAIQTGQARGNGLILFISSLINLFVIICGMWSMFNFLFAGYTLISSQSDAKAMSTVRESLTMTAIGIAIIAGSYMLAGLIGLIFFGDASFLITPKITGAIDLK